ncbi:MAG: sugar-binding domain-containing protein [Planctomycetota bacterium]
MKVLNVIGAGLSMVRGIGWVGIWVALVTSIIGLSPVVAQEKLNDSRQTISLAGEWSFRLDRHKVGRQEKWYEQRLGEVIKLPGSTDEAGYGSKTTKKELTRLSRVYHYVGPAWYQKEVVVPDSWAGKRITLFLERCHWETRLWVDSQALGMQESLCVPHLYDLTKVLVPGRHLLTICVDNTIKYNVGHWTHKYSQLTSCWAHSVTDETQTNWNGIIGRIELQASDPVWIKSVRICPDIQNKAAKAKVLIGNITGGKLDGVVTVQARLANENFSQSGKVTIDEKGETGLEIDVKLGPKVRLWDEFEPALYESSIWLSANKGRRAFADVFKTQFGMREIGTKGRQITINGRITFLRGNVECCVFPLTGYPPMDVESWERIFKIAKGYGLNHMRFHSWCPPEAAFVAADRLGFTFHVETPVWTTVGSTKSVDDFIYAESDRILESYGTHASFCMLAVGNELHGPKSKQFVARINDYWKSKDGNRLYSGGSGWPMSPTGDYVVVPKLRSPLRLYRGPLGPSTDTDYSGPVSRSTKPVVAHEISAWAVYPNLKEVDKYTGVLRARNYEVFRDSLADNHLLDRADDFLKASGRLHTLIRKAEIEILLRTAGMAGFQMLCLQDFPGQGTSPVGTLDGFWDSKGFIAPVKFREFCSETVPLLRIPKRIYTPNETLTAVAEMAHFAKGPMVDVRPSWSIDYGDGRRIASGKFKTTSIPVGNGFRLGTINFPLSQVEAPKKLVVTVYLEGASIKNQWDIWVYPAGPSLKPPAGVMMAKTLGADVKRALELGQKVLLLPEHFSSNLSQGSSFEPIFWNKLWLKEWGKDQARHLGIVCNPAHPAFAAFPTEFHTNWQWWDLLNKSTVMVMDNFEPGFGAIIQVIDDWASNHRLGFLFEAKVGKGNLMVCSLDLLNDLKHRLAARQLLSSLLAYMGGDQFAPRQAIDIKLVEDLCGDG